MNQELMTLDLSLIHIYDIENYKEHNAAIGKQGKSCVRNTGSARRASLTNRAKTIFRYADVYKRQGWLHRNRRRPRILAFSHSPSVEAVLQAVSRRRQ